MKLIRENRVGLLMALITVVFMTGCMEWRVESNVSRIISISSGP